MQQQKGHSLSLQCPNCTHPISFNILRLQEQRKLNCSSCGTDYPFQDDTLLRQISKFEALCKQIAASEEILSQAKVGVDIGGKSVQIPFNLLLTRLNSRLELEVGERKLQIQFQLEPIELAKESPK